MGEGTSFTENILSSDSFTIAYMCLGIRILWAIPGLLLAARSPLELICGVETF